jgi:hypothetical protein
MWARQDTAQVVQVGELGHIFSDSLWTPEQCGQPGKGQFKALAKFFPYEAKWHVFPDSAGSLKIWSFQGFYFPGNGLRLPRVSPAGMFGFNRSPDRFAITLGMAGLPTPPWTKYV